MPAPHPFPWIDLLIIVALVILNGLFAMSELAIVSSRGPRLAAMERVHRRGAASAIQLREDPGRFLSTVQIGITLIAIVSGAFSGEALGGPVGERLALIGIPFSWGFPVVIALTTFVSIMFGELVPKQIALRSPEPIAVVAAGPMIWLARIAGPIVWVLDRTSAGVFALLGMNREGENQVTAEELHLIVAEASTAGVIEENERAIISGVVRLADRPVREVMTPRGQVDWIDVAADQGTILAAIAESPHSRLPVAQGSVEAIVGVVRVRELLVATLEGRPLELRALMRQAPVVPDQMDAMNALETLREAEVPLALVHDEYGHFEGIVTPANLLAAIAGGAFASDVDADDDPAIVERADGSFLVSGSAPADLLAERLGIDLPEDRDYATAAGFALSLLKHLPKTGETFRDGDWLFEIVDMDGRRLDKLLASCVPAGEE
ncbi:MAG: HlyC/CorC family transporter [Sphingomonadaceae bacterium]|nr:HlyC/CorC family transporter [Sphingomonadaceae bacterium]